MPYQPIENYGIIGNLQTVALVGTDASIDFLCFPYFDSPTVFAALLDDQKGGRFELAPLTHNARRKQLYLLDSNILLSRFLSPEGVAEISDFMPIALEEDHPRGDTDAMPPHQLVRRAKAVRGELKFRLRCAPRFNYARSPYRVEQTCEHEILFICGDAGCPLALRLRSDNVPIRHEDGDVVAEFTLRAGETAGFTLEEVQAGKESPCVQPHFVADRFKRTLNFWRDWIGQGTYRGRWREMVNRSALVLKLLTSQRYGSMVAAPTFGLPESIGGGRNWDYRYTWIRDASFTLYGLNRLGYNEEAAGFMGWIERRCAELIPGGGLQLMYGIDGRHDLAESSLAHLEGYRGSSPVRIGNGASQQLQLDIYGELLDSIYLFNKFGKPIDYDFWQNISRLLDWVCENYRQPDEGIWEVRGGPQEFLYSRLMCWVAVDRGIRLAQKRSFPTPPAKWFEDARRDLPPDFHGLLGPEAPGVHADQGPAGTGRVVPDDAAGALHQRDGPPLAFDAAGHRGGPGRGFVSVPLPERRRPVGRRGHVLHVFILVRGMPRALRRFAEGAIRLREDARLREPRRVVLRGNRAQRRAPGKFPAGVHAPGIDQRRL